MHEVAVAITIAGLGIVIVLIMMCNELSKIKDKIK
jgi:hypothetical protein